MLSAYKTAEGKAYKIAKRPPDIKGSTHNQYTFIILTLQTKTTLIGGFLLPAYKCYNAFDNVINNYLRYKIMATCTTRLTDIGRGMLVSWAAGCGDNDPKSDATAPLTYLPLGYIETRGESDTPRTVANNTDISGIDTDTRVIGTDTEISVSVLDAKDLVDVTTQQALRDYYDEEVEAGRDPTAWVRITDPLLNEYRYYFCVPTSLGRSGENESSRTGEFTFTRTATNTPTNKSKQKETIPA